MKNLLSTLPNSSQGFFLSNTEIVHNVAVIHIKLGRFCACRRGKCCPNVGKVERGAPGQATLSRSSGAEDNQTCKTARAWEGAWEGHRVIVRNATGRVCVRGGWSVRWSGS